MKANGWLKKAIGEIAHCSLGKMLDKQKNKGTLRPYLRNVNVRWFEFDLSDVLEMRFEDDEAEKFTARKGDVLICEGGYPGRSAIWEGDSEIFFQKAIHRVRFHESERNRWFLYYIYFLESTGELRQYFTGTGIQHFTGQVLKRLEMPLPPLPEQQRIVGILDEAFAGIATAKANAGKNLRNARALFDSHLNATFTNNGRYAVATLAEVCTFIGGSQPPKSVFEKTCTSMNIRLIQIRDYKSDKHIVYIPRALAKRFCTADDVMIGRYGPPLFQILRGLDGAYNVALMKAVPDESKVSRDFLFYFLKNSSILEHVIFHSSRTAGQTGVTKETLEPYPIAVPSLKEQKAIVDNIRSLELETQGLESLYRQKLAALDALKKSLLHQAFSGTLSGVKRAIVEA